MDKRPSLGNIFLFYIIDINILYYYKCKYKQIKNSLYYS